MGEHKRKCYECGAMVDELYEGMTKCFDCAGSTEISEEESE